MEESHAMQLPGRQGKARHVPKSSLMRDMEKKKEAGKLGKGGQGKWWQAGMVQVAT